METHPAVGERILRNVPSYRAIAKIVRHHHERVDGGGYPDGLAGEDIPLGSRIIAVCDAYDAMTSPRPYRHRLSADDALAELRRCAGTQFDPLVVDAFCAVWQRIHGAVESVSQA
jgi:HD-GYP domain-containing protein (c-di-GMP phosphodiesterase class II)